MLEPCAVPQSSHTCGSSCWTWQLTTSFQNNQIVHLTHYLGLCSFAHVNDKAAPQWHISRQMNSCFAELHCLDSSFCCISCTSNVLLCCLCDQHLLWNHSCCQNVHGMSMLCVAWPKFDTWAGFALSPQLLPVVWICLHLDIHCICKVQGTLKLIKSMVFYSNAMLLCADILMWP